MYVYVCVCVAPLRKSEVHGLCQGQAESTFTETKGAIKEGRRCCELRQ